MSLAPAALRSRIEEQITTALGGGSPPWKVATLAFDLFPGADLNDREALSFAVGLPSTVFTDGRRPLGGQAAAQSTVGVRFSSYLRSDAHVADYDVALGREQALIAAVQATPGLGGPSPWVLRVDREVVGDGTLFVATVVFGVFHGYPLT